MLTVSEQIDKVHEITDELECKASEKLAKAQEYHRGYVQACEDFGREMRRVISNE